MSIYVYMRFYVLVHSDTGSGKPTPNPRWNAITLPTDDLVRKSNSNTYASLYQVGMQLDNFTFPFALKACARLSSLQEGMDIHDCIVRGGLESNIHVSFSLLQMYAKCMRRDDACQVFDKMFSRDVVVWNAMIIGYVQNGHTNEALALFSQMQVAEVILDSFTLASVLQACSHLISLQ
eukprot:Gb_28922 [translate_table: standard]